jgi:hypothetical protein
MRIVSGLICALLISACGDPFIVIPGGKLSGAVTPAPADWSMVHGVETIQVETRPGKPYSINIWGAGIGGDLYIATSPDGTTWTEFIAGNPQVRVRIDEQLFELTAVKVTDTDEQRRVSERYAEKYELEGDDNWVADGMIFRLDRRGASS